MQDQLVEVELDINGQAKVLNIYNINKNIYSHQNCQMDHIRTTYDPFFNYFNNLNHERRDYTFSTFVNRTDEKKQTVKIATEFLNRYLEKYIRDCSVFDAGSGEAELSLGFGNYMKTKCKDLIYAGMDRSESFVTIAKNKFNINGIKNNFIQGDVFNITALSKFHQNSTLLIASQVIFYAPSIITFVDSIIHKFDKVAFIITQSDDSFLNQMNIKYAIGKKINTESALRNVLVKYNEFIDINTKYQSVIEFPSIDTKFLARIAGILYEGIIDNEERDARNILEFVAGSTMEDLFYRGKLKSFLEDIEQHLKRNDNKIIFWNNMVLVVPSDYIASHKLQKFWQEIEEIKLSNNLSPFEQAISEGNLNIAQTLVKDGLIIVENNENSLFKTITSPLELFFHKRISNSSYKNDIIYKKQYSLFGLAVTKNDTAIAQYLVNEIKTTTDIKQTTYAYQGYTYFNIFNYGIWTILTTFGYYFIGKDKNTFILLIENSLNLAICGYTLFKYYNTGNSNLHLAIMNNNVELSKIIISSTQNKNIEDDITSEWQNALHIASKNNNLEIAKFLVEQKHFDFLREDYYGFTPLHYAITSNNHPLFLYFVYQGALVHHPIKDHKTKAVVNFLLHLSFLYATAELCKFNSIDIGRHIILSLSSAPFIANVNIPIMVIFLKIFFPMSGIIQIAKNATNPFKINTLENPLHLAIKADSIETAKFLSKCNLPVLKNSSYEHSYLYMYSCYSNIKATNIYGEEPIHYAAAKGKVYLIKELLSKGANINSFAKYELQSVTYLKYAGPIITFLGTQWQHSTFKFMLTTVLFLKALFIDELFDEINYSEFGTPLHYAVHYGYPMKIFFNLTQVNETIEYINNPKADNSSNGSLFDLFKFMELSSYSLRIVPTSLLFTDGKSIASHENKKELKTIKYLIENGADPDITIHLELYPENVYIFLSLVVLSVYIPHGYIQKTISTIGTIIVSSFLFPVLHRFVKPIDYLYGKEESNTYKYLKQYTSANIYSSSSETIHMKDYGMYKSGGGNDIFIVYPNFNGKEQGYKLIIKDFTHKDKIDLSNFVTIREFSDLKFNQTIIMKTTSTIILSEIDEQELVTLYGVSMSTLGEEVFSF